MTDDREPVRYPEVLSVTDVARLLQIEEQTVRALARRGELPGVKLGKHWRFLRDELMAALRPPPPPLPPPPPVRPQERAISQDEAAELLGVSTRTVRRMMRTGALETVRSPTGATRLARSSVQAYLGTFEASAGGGTEHGEH